MNRPPDNPYSNNIRHRNQASNTRYPSPYKPGSYPGVPQKPPQANGGSGRTSKGQPSRGSAQSKKKASVESQKDQGQGTWDELIEQPVQHRKLHRRVVDLITITVVLVLIGAGAATFLNLIPSDSSTPQIVRIVNVAVPTEIPATPIAGAVGKTTQAGSWDVTITHVKTIKAPADSGSNQIYMEISLKLKNISASPQILVSLLEFLVSSDNDVQLHEVLTDPDIKQPPDGNISAGQTLQAQIAFALPKTTHTCTLDFQYGLIDHSKASVRWQIKW